MASGEEVMKQLQEIHLKMQVLASDVSQLKMSVSQLSDMVRNMSVLRTEDSNRIDDITHDLLLSRNNLQYCISESVLICLVKMYVIYFCGECDSVSMKWATFMDEGMKIIAAEEDAEITTIDMISQMNELVLKNKGYDINFTFIALLKIIRNQGLRIFALDSDVMHSMKVQKKFLDMDHESKFKELFDDDIYCVLVNMLTKLRSVHLRRVYL
jgi:hypothetical protein